MAFDVISPVRLSEAEIPLATGSIYTVPAATRTLIKDIDISNTTAAAITVSVYIGSGATVANTLIPNVTVPAYSVFQWTGSQIINAAEQIQAIASAAGCAIHISGGEAV